MKIGAIYTGRVRVEEIVSFDVSPGTLYQTTIRARERLHLHEVLVYDDFTLVELYVDHFFVPVKPRASFVAGCRAYQVGRAGVEVKLSGEVMIHLKNETDRPLRARQVAFEEERRS